MNPALIALISLIFLKSGTCINDFPSLMVANATMSKVKIINPDLDPDLLI